MQVRTNEEATAETMAQLDAVWPNDPLWAQYRGLVLAALELNYSKGSTDSLYRYSLKALDGEKVTS